MSYTMRKIQFGSSMLLFLTACIWGLAFVAQSVGMDYMGPFTFSFSRFFLGGFVLLPILLVKRKATLLTDLNPMLFLNLILVIHEPIH